MTRLKYDIKVHSPKLQIADVKEVDFCCDHFKKWFNEYIEFSWVNELQEFCFYIESYKYFYTNDEDVFQLKIFKCPFCGETLVSLPQKRLEKKKIEKNVKMVSYDWEEI